MTLHGLAILVASAVVLPAALFATLPPVTDQLALFSQYLGTVALGLMAWAQIWATRLPGVEAVFGPLDRVYILHKWTGITALLAMLAHDTIDADMNGLTGWPLTDLGETLGELSFYGIIALSLLSVITFIPYHLWKWTHKAMGALFIAGGAHVLMIEKPFALTDPLGLFMIVAVAVGSLAYIITLLPRPSTPYAVAAVTQTGGATAVTLTPSGTRRLSARPGQFVSVAFDGALAEPHPFTLSAPVRDDGTLEVTIKSLGDYTGRVATGLTTGTAAKVSGPFGRFTRRAGTKPEIWIAGGIGITPFLAWAEALSPDQSTPIDLIWAVRSEAEAPHLDRVRALADAHPSLHLTLIDGSTGDRLTPDRLAGIAELKGAKFAYCGPDGLRRGVEAALRANGVSPRHLKHEAFEFRTGLGLRRLLTWASGKVPGLTGAVLQNDRFGR